MNKKNIHFIVNPISGNTKQGLIKDIIPKHLDLKKYNYKISYTKAPKHAIALSKSLLQSGYCDIIAAVGGDGTMNEIAQSIVNSNIVMGIIPTGSGNGLANYFKIPYNFKKAINILNSYKTLSIDTASINNNIFTSISGVGFDAFVAEKFAKERKRGFWTYFKIILKEYSKYLPQEYIIEVNNSVLHKEALLISFANSNQFGNNVIISPNASIIDGLIDICILKKVPAIKAYVLAYLLFFNKIHKSKYAEIIKCSDFKIIQKQKSYVNLDGEAIEMGNELNIKVKPKSLKIIIP